MTPVLSFTAICDHQQELIIYLHQCPIAPLLVRLSCKLVFGVDECICVWFQIFIFESWFILCGSKSTVSFLFNTKLGFFLEWKKSYNSEMLCKRLIAAHVYAKPKKGAVFLYTTVDKNCSDWLIQDQWEAFKYFVNDSSSYSSPNYYECLLTVKLVNHLSKSSKLHRMHVPISFDAVTYLLLRPIISRSEVIVKSSEVTRHGGALICARIGVMKMFEHAATLLYYSGLPAQ